MAPEVLSLSVPAKDSSILDEVGKAKDNKALKVAMIVADVSTALFSTAVAIWMGYKHFSSTDTFERYYVECLLAGACNGLFLGPFERTSVNSSRELVAFSAKDIAKTIIMISLHALCAKIPLLNIPIFYVSGIRATRVFFAGRLHDKLFDPQQP